MIRWFAFCLALALTSCASSGGGSGGSWASRAWRTATFQQGETAPAPSAAVTPATKPSPSPVPAASPTPGSGAATAPVAREKGWFDRTLDTVPFLREKQDRSKPGPKEQRDMVLEVSSDPAAIKLSERRTVDLVITLRNTGKKVVVLEFPNSRRYEIVTKSGGREIARLPEDRAAAPVIGHLIVNPGERVEYRELVSLRGQTAGVPGSFEVTVPATVPFTGHLNFVPER